MHCVWVCCIYESKSMIQDNQGLMYGASDMDFKGMQQFKSMPSM